MSADRLKDAWRAAQGTDPLIRYRCLYRAKVLGQGGDLQTVSVRPFDPSLPDMADIPLWHGIPGIKVQVQPGCTVQVGWDDGKPFAPYAALWSADANAVKVVLAASSLMLGGDGATQRLVYGDTWKLTFDTLMTLLTSAMSSVQPVAVDGGVSIEALLTGIAAAQQAQYLSPTVKTT
jgi:hypothetical protein